MRILAGTSGWQYKEWKGSFYPSDLSTDGMLGYYADRFSTVEVNNTFYRMPKESVLRGWAGSVPDGFEFVVKASQRITHHARLREAATEPLGYLLKALTALGDRQGPILFQLPPNLKLDLPRLTAFLELLPPGTRAVFELRHPSWLEEDEVISTLQARGVALCIANTDDEETPRVATAGFGYLRLRKTAYADGELEEWAGWIRSQPWSDAYVFFKHEDEGTGPRLAARFMEICGADAGGAG